MVNISRFSYYHFAIVNCIKDNIISSRCLFQLSFLFSCQHRCVLTLRIFLPLWQLVVFLQMTAKIVLKKSDLLLFHSQLLSTLMNLGGLLTAVGNRLL